MKSTEVKKIVKEFAASLDQEWEFYRSDDYEMIAFSSDTAQYSDDPNDVVEIKKTLCLFPDNVLFSKADAKFDVNPEKREHLAAYLESCEEDQPFSFFLDDDETGDECTVTSGLEVDCNEEDAEEKFADNNYLEAIFHLPAEALADEWEKIIALFGRLSPAEERPELRKEIRYYMEQEKLPHLYFHEERAAWECQFTQEQLFDYATKLFEQNGLKMPYQISDYQVDVNRSNKDYTLQKITLPKPEDSLLCSKIYLMYNADCTKQFYFTIERGESEKDYFLCGRDSEGGHQTYEIFRRSKLDPIKIMEKVFFGKRRPLLESR